MPEAKIIQIGTNQAAESDVAGHMERLLSQLGLESDIDFVEPEAPALRRSLVHGLQNCNVVIIIGSFGPYGVSGAKETIFKALDIPFSEDEVVKGRIQHYAKARQLDITEDIESLWMLPRNAEPFPSENGVDSGFGIAAGGQCILMLPSSPDSFHPIVTGDALSYLARFFGLQSACHRVNCFGLSRQSIIDELYGDILRDNLPLVYPASCHDGLETSLWVTACAATKEQAEELCHPAVFRLQQELKDIVYAVDEESMERHMLTVLREQGKTLCISESYSSGALAKGLEQGMEYLDGMESPILFYGNYMLPSETSEIGLPRRKLKGQEIVSPAGAGMMAEYCRRKGQGNSLGLSLCLDEAVRRVYSALSDGEKVYLSIYPLPNDCFGNRAGKYGSMCALKLLQQYFLAPRSLPVGIPVRMAASGQGFPEAEDPNWEEKLGRPVSNSPGRKIAMLVCAAVFVISSTFLVHQKYLAWDSEQQKSELESIYMESSSGTQVSSPSQEESNYPAEYLYKFSSLYSINPDIKGWLSIDGTDFSYPVVQSEKDTPESQYYLRRDFQGDYNDHGVPFLDYRADLKKPSDNLIIYGHNMRDGTMFEELLHYKELDYYKAHPLIRFDSVYEEANYRVVAMFITNTLKSHGELFEYHNFINSPSDDAFDEFLYGIRIRSILNTGVDVQAGDKLLTLSTCSYEFKGARFVVVARKLRDGESLSDAEDVSAASKNENVLYPDIWYSLYKQEKPNISLMRIVLPKPSETINLDLTMTLTQETAPPSELEDIAPLPQNVEVLPVVLPASPDDSTELLQTDTSGGTEGEEAGNEGGDEPPASSEPPVSSESPSAPSQIELTVPDSSMPSSSSEEPPESSSQPESSSSSEQPSEPEEIISSSSSREDVVPSSSSSSQAGVITISSAPKKTITVRPASSAPEDDEVIEPDDPEDSEEQDNTDEDFESSYTGDETLSVYINGSRYNSSAYDIVCQVVAAEMGSAHKEALKAQAVAAYTYIAYENARGVSPSVVAKTPTAAVQAAVKEVIGEAVYYKGSLAFTCYHATSAGKTNSSADVWGGNYPYLITVDSSIDEDAYRFEDTKRISSSAVASAVEKQLGISLDGDPADWFEILSYTDGGYVDRISVGGETQYYYDSTRKYYPITGRVIREAVLGLRSACFTVEYLDNRDEFLFTTYGYGHGVGMSQTGAMLMADQGDSYVDILEHYFPGTTVR